MIGVEGDVGGMDGRREGGGAQPRTAGGTGGLEWARGMRKAGCSGEREGGHGEVRLRRRRSGAGVALERERVGIEQD